jgi:hypothetical protein
MASNAVRASDLGIIEKPIELLGHIHCGDIL